MTNFEEKQFLEHDEYVPKIKIELEKLTGGDLDKLEQCEDLANAFATYDRNVFAYLNPVLRIIKGSLQCP